MFRQKNHIKAQTLKHNVTSFII